MITLKEIALELGGLVKGDGDTPIRGISSIKEAESGDIAVLMNPAFRKALAQCRASALILGEETDIGDLADRNLVLVKDPSLAYLKAAYLFSKPKGVKEGIDPSARVSETAAVADGVSIGAYVCVEKGALIGKDVTLYPFVYVGEGAVVGEGSTIYPHVTLCDGTKVGKRVTIHAGTVIGADGFRYMWDGKSHVKIPQLGIVEIGDDVEIGANAAIDRASLGATRIGRGTKIDNLVQIAHNVTVGEDSIIVSQVGIAGSATIGKNVILAGQAGVRDHATVGDRVQAGGQAGITGDVSPGSQIMGTPHMPIREWARLQGYLKRLPRLFGTVKQIEKKLRLEDSNDRD